MNKKGVEISMSTIIVAAIGLLVLVVLSAIFLGRAGKVGEQVADCEVQGGKCAENCGSIEDGTEDYPRANPLLKCSEEGQKCCIPIKV
jgi:hypothetical protein